MITHIPNDNNIKFIDKLNEKFDIINKYKKIKNINISSDEIIQLIPPYNLNCDFNECIKSASVEINKKKYCWFHCRKID